MASNNDSNVSKPKPKPKPKPNPKPKIPKPTIRSTFDEIDEYWKSKNKRIGTFGVSKSNNPNVICTICYFDCIENDKGIQIQFLRRSNINHWDFQHKKLYEKYVKNYNKKKNIIYFVLNETGNILTGDIKSKNDIIEKIKSLPQKKITYPKLDSFVNKPIANEANTNKNQSTSDKHEMEEDLDDVDIDIDNNSNNNNSNNNNSNNNNIRKRPISVLESDEFEVEEPPNKKRKLNDNVGQGNNVIKGVQYPPLPAMDSNTNEWMKYFGTFLPAMRDEIIFKFKTLTKQLETYEDRIC